MSLQRTRIRTQKQSFRCENLQLLAFGKYFLFLIQYNYSVELFLIYIDFHLLCEVIMNLKDQIYK